MHAIDFEYDGRCLSDYGFLICHFDASGGAVVENGGSKIVFNKASRNRGRSNVLSSTRYDECITAEFDICKNPDDDSYEDPEISSEEYAQISRWLNRHEFLRFQAFDIKDFNRDQFFYNASFNIDRIRIGGKLVGLRLYLETDSPFAYGAHVTHSLVFTNSSLTQAISDVSDEIGDVHATFSVTCSASGDLTIHNSYNNQTMLVRNCSSGEQITINSEVQIITTSSSSHDIANDFNYEFMRIGNTFNSRINTITVSRPCSITIQYYPLLKSPIL